MASRPGLGRIPEPDPKRAIHDERYRFSAETSDKTERWWRQDGAWLDQNGYGTCVAFALSHRMADKPVFQETAHPTEFANTNSWAFDLYREATGDTSMQEGTYADVVARELARRGLISRYEWITTPEDLTYALLERGSVGVGIPWFNSMFDPYKGDDGHAWLDVDESSGLAGGHELLVNAVRLEPPEDPTRLWWKSFYRLKNSWGQWWGDRGTVRVAVEDLHRLVFQDWGDAIWLEEVS